MPDRDEEARQARRLQKEYRRIRRQKRRSDFRRRLLPMLLTAACAVGACALLLLAGSPKRTPPDPDVLQLRMLDVGQGDAFLLTAQGHSVLIDAGEPEQGIRVLQCLRALGIRRLDFAVNSHPHADHIGGMAAILSEIPAQALYLPDFPAVLTPASVSFTAVLDCCAASDIPIRAGICGETIPIGSASLQFLCTDNSAYTDLNNCSLGCLVTYGKQRILLAGDLEQEGEADWLAAVLVPDVQVLKVSHHGSSSSSSAAFLEAASPKIALISCGAGNDYGHPSPAALRRLRDADCEVYRTDLDGDVLLTFDGGSGITVQTQQNFSGSLS